jgi:RAB6A-GEF complex partner protein 1
VEFDSIQTSQSYLVLLSVDYDPTELVYQTTQYLTSAAAQRNFSYGPGEGLPLTSVKLLFEGVVRVDGVVVRCTF